MIDSKNPQNWNIFNEGFISDDECQEIINYYGEYLVDVNALNDEEAFFFSQQDTITPDLCTQTLYKLKSTHNCPPIDTVNTSYGVSPNNDVITPASFQKLLRRFINNNKALRTSYYKTKDGNVYSVLLASTIPVNSLSFHLLDNSDITNIDQKLSDLMTSAHHYALKLSNIFIPHISIYKITNQEYAVIITQPQIIANRWDPLDLLRTLLHPDDIQENIKTVNSPYNAVGINTTADRSTLIEYWKKTLHDLSAKPSLPGYHEPIITEPLPMAYKVILSDTNTEKFKNLINTTDRTLWAALLQTAWAITLSTFKPNTHDLHFPVLMPLRGSNIANFHINRLNNAMPIRITLNPDETICELVKKQLSQLISSQPLGRPTRQELISITGDESHYNHLISFQNFWTDRIPFSHIKDTGITLADASVTDLGKDFAVYFRYVYDHIEIEAIYNEHSIAKNNVSLIID